MLLALFQATSAEERTVVILAAPPCSGKGTMSPHISEALHIPHLSTGDMLRAAAREGTSSGLEAASAMAAGRLVSDALVNDIVKDRLAKADCENGFLLDGYPRNMEQARFLDDVLSATHDAVSAVIEIAMPLEAEQECIAGRWVSPSGASYNANPKCLHGLRPRSLPPGATPVCDPNDMAHCNMKDDDTGVPLYRRSDDDPNILVKRVHSYLRATQPILNHYAGVLRRVNGNQKESDVLADVQTLLGPQRFLRARLEKLQDSELPHRVPTFDGQLVLQMLSCVIGLSFAALCWAGYSAVPRITATETPLLGA